MSTIPGDQELPLAEHVKELRNRMLVVTLVLAAGVISVFPFSGDLIGLMWNDLMPSQMALVVYTPLEWIMTRLVLSLALALIPAVPVFLYESFLFMKKGLYPNERRFFIVVVPTSLLLFLAGTCVAYFLVIPLIFNYMVYYSADVAASGLSVRQTFSLVTTLLVVFGVLFQFPMVMIFFIKSGLLKREQLKNKRMLVYGILIGIAMFAAPDITGMSQLIMAFFLLVLFEFSLLISRFI